MWCRYQAVMRMAVFLIIVGIIGLFVPNCALCAEALPKGLPKGKELIIKVVRGKEEAKKALLGLQHGQNKDVTVVEKNYCRDKADIPNDKYLYSKGSWRQKYDDQWAIKHIGFTTDTKSAWNVEDGSSNPVVVAVIDTGFDWNHKDIDWDNILKNPEETPNNGKDDDGNRYVDDVIGWNFIGDNNKPWDHDGHGTL